MNSDVSDEPQCPLWERLNNARNACVRMCRRRGRRVAPEDSNGKNSARSRESRRRINHAPAALYSAFGERIRTSTPAALQCALFCGGSRCQYEQPPHKSTAIQGLYSDWITDDILAMARPSTISIVARNIIQQFHSWGIRTVVNLQMPGEHASCGRPLTSSGFTYDPTIFMASDIYYYNFAWPDYGEASLSGLLDMIKVLSFALEEGKVAIHCHAAPDLSVEACTSKKNIEKILDGVQNHGQDWSRITEDIPNVSIQECETIFNDLSKQAKKQSADFIRELKCTGLGRTGVLIACYLVFALRIRANDAIRLVRKRRPKSVQTSGQILCVQQFEHYILPQTVVFSSKEPLKLTKDYKCAEFTLRQYLYRQRAILHGLEERAFKELPKIIYCLCERLLKLCGCHQSIGVDLRVRNKPFYKSFMAYRIRQKKPPDPRTPEDIVLGDQVTSLPMVEWRDPVEEDIEKNLEAVSRLTGNSNYGTITALQVYEAFIMEHNSLPEDRKKYLKQFRSDINQRRETMNKIDEEEDPIILTGLLFEWMETLKQPILDKEDLAMIIGRAHNVESCILGLQLEDIMLLEYILRFIIHLRPLAANKKIDIMKRFLASLTHQAVNINGQCLPLREFSKLREGSCGQVINFMLRMIVELQKDMMKPGSDDTDVVLPNRRLRIKAWK